MTEKATHLAVKRFRFVRDEEVVVIYLDRPGRANAFNGTMMASLTDLLMVMSQREQLRVVVIAAKGQHFCGGADLQWMVDDPVQTPKQADGSLALQGMLEALVKVPCPTLAVIHGKAIGGALGLIAACDLAIASEDSQYCLREVRLGLVPGVIMPYLGRKLPLAPLTHYSLTGELFGAEQAQMIHLVHQVVPKAQLGYRVDKIVGSLLQGAPLAQRHTKKLIEELRLMQFAQGQWSVDAITKARKSAEAQQRIASFFNKKPLSCEVDLSVALCHESESGS